MTTNHVSRSIGGLDPTWIAKVRESALKCFSTACPTLDARVLCAYIANWEMRQPSNCLKASCEKRKPVLAQQKLVLVLAFAIAQAYWNTATSAQGKYNGSKGYQDVLRILPWQGAGMSMT